METIEELKEKILHSHFGGEDYWEMKYSFKEISNFIDKAVEITKDEIKSQSVDDLIKQRFVMTTDNGNPPEILHRKNMGDTLSLATLDDIRGFGNMAFAKGKLEKHEEVCELCKDTSAQIERERIVEVIKLQLQDYVKLNNRMRTAHFEGSATACHKILLDLGISEKEINSTPAPVEGELTFNHPYFDDCFEEDKEIGTKCFWGNNGACELQSNCKWKTTDNKCSKPTNYDALLEQALTTFARTLPNMQIEEVYPFVREVLSGLKYQSSAPVEEKEFCEWVLDGFYYKTSCGNSTREDNVFQSENICCRFCGKPIKAKE